jgi:hypothetical protein
VRSPSLFLEDVQEFEKAVTKSGRQPEVDEHQETNESEEEEEEEEDENPKQRRKKVRAKRFS